MWHFECYCGKHICACICDLFLCVCVSLCLRWLINVQSKDTIYSPLMIKYTLNINIWIVHLHVKSELPKKTIFLHSIIHENLSVMLFKKKSVSFSLTLGSILSTPGIQPWIHRSTFLPQVPWVLKRWWNGGFNKLLGQLLLCVSMFRSEQNALVIPQ